MKAIFQILGLWVLAFIGFFPIVYTNAAITKFHVVTKIEMRYAITNVETMVHNEFNEEKEVFFNMFIPKEAFVSNFSMVIKDKTYVAKVDTKENANEIFENSVTTSGVVHSFNDAKFKNGKLVSLTLKIFTTLKYIDILSLNTNFLFLLIV